MYLTCAAIAAVIVPAVWSSSPYNKAVQLNADGHMTGGIQSYGEPLVKRGNSTASLVRAGSKRSHLSAWELDQSPTSFMEWITSKFINIGLLHHVRPMMPQEAEYSSLLERDEKLHVSKPSSSSDEAAAKGPCKACEQEGLVCEEKALKGQETFTECSETPSEPKMGFAPELRIQSGGTGDKEFTALMYLQENRDKQWKTQTCKGQDKCEDPAICLLDDDESILDGSEGKVVCVDIQCKAKFPEACLIKYKITFREVDVADAKNKLFLLKAIGGGSAVVVLAIIGIIAYCCMKDPRKGGHDDGHGEDAYGHPAYAYGDASPPPAQGAPGAW